MRRHYIFLLGLVTLSLLAGIGCADPAKDKPRAVVNDPTQPVAGASGERYVIGPESKIGFIGSKVTGSHEGGFKGFDGEIRLANGDPTASSVSVTIDTTTLWADNDRLTGHLKSPDFFDVETHPVASFKSTSIVREEDRYRITGNLDLHGVVKSISFPAQITVEDDRVTATADFSIKRFDFGIAYKGKADDLIRDDVVIQLDLVGTPA